MKSENGSAQKRILRSNCCSKDSVPGGDNAFQELKEIVWCEVRIRSRVLPADDAEYVGTRLLKSLWARIRILILSLRTMEKHERICKALYKE